MTDDDGLRNEEAESNTKNEGASDVVISEQGPSSVIAENLEKGSRMLYYYGGSVDHRDPSVLFAVGGGTESHEESGGGTAEREGEKQRRPAIAEDDDEVNLKFKIRLVLVTRCI